ncbi:hypothetical protein DCAR_0521346 [Daucus carota subsp. sativus]|uniref:Uncharacterized protein n=1 Tax=Daucus carota subsp. sativus TaxID=79200 RepID=A0AAF0X7U5_DAUCS|nr:hypothetical protein DCAR_0521346 [Daucus carota subsp. sativus]
MLDDQCSQSYWMEFLQLLIILVQPIGSSQFLIASSRYICLLRLALTLPCISVHTGVLVRCTRCLSMNTQRIKIKLDFQNLLRPSCALTIDDYKNEGDVLHCYQMKSKSGHANKNGPLITIIKMIACANIGITIASSCVSLSDVNHFLVSFFRSELLYHVGANSSEVMCDTYTPAHEPILANKRCNAAKILSHPDLQLKFLEGVVLALTENTSLGRFGIEQEYTLLKKEVNWPIGWPIEGCLGRQFKLKRNPIVSCQGQGQILYLAKLQSLLPQTYQLHIASDLRAKWWDNSRSSMAKEYINIFSGIN